MACFSTNRIVFILITLWVVDSLSAIPGHTSQHPVTPDPGNPVELSTSPNESTSNNEIPSGEVQKDSPQKHRKKKRCRGRQKTFLRNPNYIIPNKCYEKESQRASMRKLYRNLPLPHPGAKGGSSQV
ncbi:hypothetical protein KR067_008689, partial [Drosophila pandora]